MEGYRRNKHYLHETISTYCSKIIFLQEIWLPHSNSNILTRDFLRYNFQVPTPDMFTPAEDMLGSPGHAWHGVALGWHDDLSNQATPLESSYDRFAAARIILGSKTFLTISLYAPTSGKDDEFLECFSHLSSFLNENKRAGDTVLIGTDSNCSEKSTTRRKNIFTRFCSTYSLKIQATAAPTFHHNNLTSESCIDCFLISGSETSVLGQIQQLCTLEDPTNLSSHDVLISNLKVEVTAGETDLPKYAHTYADFNQKRIIWDKSKVEV